jgi:hypothetical protein
MWLVDEKSGVQAGYYAHILHPVGVLVLADD